MTGPCPTCRHEVDHLIALDIEISAFRAKARALRSRSLHGLRGLDLRRFFSDVAAAEKATERHRQHRLDEHRDDRRATLVRFGVHLLGHANEGAAA